jgi:DNA-binding CsgD family transcriptional regulator
MISIQDSNWYDLLVQLQQSAGTASFFPTLSETLRQVVRFDCAGVMFYNGSEVVNLYAEEFSPHYSKYIDLYLKGLYLLDPHYNLLAKGTPSGLYRFSDIAPDCYHDTQYYKAFVKPAGITDEYDFIVKAGNCYVDFFMDKLGGGFSEKEGEILVTISPLISHTLKEHWQKQGQKSRPQNDSKRSNTYQSIFDSLGKSILTKREQEVIQCILHGHSSKSLAIKLNISPSTVKIHRKNIYKKLDITTQSELFSLCLQSLSIKELSESEDPLGALMSRSMAGL